MLSRAPDLFEGLDAQRRQALPLQAAPDAGEERNVIDFGALFAVLRRRLLAILVIGGLGAALAAAIAIQLPTRYGASTTVIFNTRTMNVVDFQSVLSGLSLRTETLESEMTLIRSASILERVVERLRLDEKPEFAPWLRPESQTAMAISAVSTFVTGLIPQRAWDLLASLSTDEAAPAQPSGLSIEAIRRNVVVQNLRAALTVAQIDFAFGISIRALSESPGLAAAIANTVAQVYIDDQLGMKAQATEEAARWLSERVVAQRAALDATETKLRTLSNTSSVPDESGLAAKAAQLQSLRERARAAEAQAIDAEGMHEVVAAAVAAGDFDGAAKLVSAPSSALRRAMSGGGPTALQAAVTAEELRMREAATRLRQSADALAASVRRLADELAVETETRVQVERLTSDLEADRLIYESLLARLNETANQFGGLQAEARIVSRAFPSDTPAEPKRLLIVVVGGMVGLMLGCALAFLLEAANQRVRSARELERRTGIPVLAQLPLLPASGRRTRFLERIAKSPVAIESAQTLRTALSLRQGGIPPRVVMVTSSSAGDGKSVTCLMLAHAAAMIGKSVVIVDADFRRPTLMKVLGAPPAVDFVAVLEGRAELEAAIHVEAGTEIAMLPIRRPAVNASRLVSSEGFESVLSSLRARYDLVILDAPPVLPVADAFLIGKLADAVVFAVRWHETKRGTVELGVSKLERHGLHIVGAVLTSVDFKRAKRYDATGYSDYHPDNPYLRA